MGLREDAIAAWRQESAAQLEAELERLNDCRERIIAKVQKRLGINLGLDVFRYAPGEEEEFQIVLASEDIRLACWDRGGPVRLMGTCPKCGQLCAGVLDIWDLADLGQALSEPFQPCWQHDERCKPGPNSAHFRTWVQRLQDLLHERYR